MRAEGVVDSALLAPALKRGLFLEDGQMVEEGRVGGDEEVGQRRLVWRVGV